MWLSVPVYRLKRQARLLSRASGVPLNQALDSVAKDERYRSWSHLAASQDVAGPARRMLERLKPGDLVLLGGRPGHGKTQFALDLLVETLRSGGRGVFFTFEYALGDMVTELRAKGLGADMFGGGMLEIDTSDLISADYVTGRMEDAAPGTLIVIDYLQLLDQRRDTPPLVDQVSELKGFVARTGAIVICLSQVDRSYDPAIKDLPDLTDVRLPNPLDLRLFDKACFLANGRMRLDAVA